MKLFKRLISAEVTSKAKKQKKLVHAKKEKGMVPDEDLSKFLLGLREDIETTVAALKKTPTKELWKELRDLLFTYITSFNR